MRVLLSILLGVFIIIGVSSAKEESAQSLIESSGKRTTEKVQAREMSKVIKEAVNVYAKGNRVLFLLNHNKIEEAKKVLDQLVKELDKLSTQYKKMDRLPIDAVITEISGITDIKEAEKLAKEAKKAVEDNDFIKARFILNSLRDEIQIETFYLPLSLYTEAVKLAQKLLKEGKVKDAIAQLQVAIGLVEVETTIIPKPLAIASLLVEDASKAFKKNPEKALKLLDEAKRQIKLAKVLGYIKTEKDISPLIAQIEKLEKEIKEKAGRKEHFKKVFENIEKVREKATQTR
ncbi:YfdX protein [Persephonella hydrogeniphila]|uniref:YfdX protein n=1 Tax=Persephonella hydrogeniphila TaxID=198703 RepID=A0A285N1F1_9AQUI|nr:YfdX family protein [Persephonella hydrogeniphila]SNZ03260.1 YfdX protein [Persephonella hydrogeniphila]